MADEFFSIIYFFTNVDETTVEIVFFFNVQNSEYLWFDIYFFHKHPPPKKTTTEVSR